MIMIELSQKISTMESSRTREKLYIIVNSSHRTSSRIEIQKRHDLSMQDLPSLMAFLGKESHKYPSIPTRINAVSIWSRMECGMSSPFQTHTIKRWSGIFFYISLYFPWTMWTAMYRVFRKAMRQISMWFRTWHGQEYTWGVLYQILFFRRYWHWFRWQKPDLSSLLPPWLHLSPILMILWKRLLLICRVSK